MKSKLLLLFFVVIGLPILGEEVQIELRDGSVLRGEILSKDSSELKLKTLLGEQRITRAQVSQKSLAALQWVSDDPVELKTRLADMERRIATLEAENQQLRRELTARPEPPAPFPPRDPTPPRQTAVQQPPGSEKAVGYWLSATRKRHHSKCRYYQTGKGRACGPDEGAPCKICGG